MTAGGPLWFLPIPLEWKLALIHAFPDIRW